MRTPIRFLILAVSIAAVSGCGLDGPPADPGETGGAAGVTYECLDLCPPPGAGALPCHHICVLNHDPPEIGGSAAPSVCNRIHVLECGDGCCDSQEAARFENGRFIRSSCPSDCLIDKIGATLEDDGRMHVSDGTVSLATFIGEFLVSEATCR